MRISDWSSDVCSSDLGISADDRADTRSALPGSDTDQRAGGNLSLAPAHHRDRLGLGAAAADRRARCRSCRHALAGNGRRSEEHTSELQSLMRISYAVFCLKKKKIYKRYK